jgi:hypothetical protein
LFQNALRAEDIEISASQMPPDAYAGWTPSALSTCDLSPTDFAVREGHPGLYHGSCSDFADLVSYWNICATGRQVLFYDPAFHERLIDTASHFLNALRQRPEDLFREPNGIAVWNKSRETAIDTTPFGERLSRAPLSAYSMYGCLPASLMGFREHSVLGTSSAGDRPSFTFELPPKPFFPDDTLHGRASWCRFVRSFRRPTLYSRRRTSRRSTYITGVTPASSLRLRGPKGKPRHHRGGDRYEPYSPCALGWTESPYIRLRERITVVKSRDT